MRFEHVLVWERHHGMPVPSGLEIHHANEDKLDNRIENLRAVTRLEHKRLHGGCELRDGVWWKRCRDCGVMKSEADFYCYPGRSGLSGFCRPCTVARAVRYKQLRKERERRERQERSTTAVGERRDVSENTPADAEVSSKEGN
jgi:hypothetical protein